MDKELIVANLLGIDLDEYKSFGRFPLMVKKSYDSWINMLQTIKPERKQKLLDKLRKVYKHGYCCYCKMDVLDRCMSKHIKSNKHKNNVLLYSIEI